jgi:uncharacterized lipoprotein YmbA
MNRKFLQAAACIAALLLAACAAKTPPAQFYLLQAQMVKTAAVEHLGVIGVGPVDLPAYLDRPQIVTGLGGAQYQLDEFQRWAEPLKDNITQVLADDLAQQAPGAHILVFPWNRAIVPDYQISLQIGRFHAGPQGQIELQANWSVFHQNQPLLLKSSHIQVPVADPGYGAKVIAHSQALAQLSQEIAQALQNLALK